MDKMILGTNRIDANICPYLIEWIKAVITFNAGRRQI